QYVQSPSNRMAAEGALLELTAIPRMVSEAIDCTRSMGVPYLLVDRLCIIQHDAFTRSATLRRMHRVYMNAYFTTVAAS
ncbi:hypothetical protein B0H63DRAFT_362497, partial [Podospora didyma]